MSDTAQIALTSIMITMWVASAFECSLNTFKSRKRMLFWLGSALIIAEVIF